MELHRLSEIIPLVKEGAAKRGWKVLSHEGATLEVEVNGECHVLDIREHTGPIHWPSLKDWIEQLGKSKLVLLTMGFFPKKTLSELLKDPARAGRVVLMGMGLRDFFDTEFRPRRLGPASALAEVVEEALTGRGLSPQAISCDYCAERPLATCKVCGSLLCKSHFIPCPLCGARLCHPDVKNCYFQHEC